MSSFGTPSKKSCKTRKDAELAKSRWKTLAMAIKNIKKGQGFSAQNIMGDSTFRFPSYGIIQLKPDIAPDSVLDRLWLRISAPSYHKVDLKVCIRSPQSVKLKDLTGFNNTGNICVWPSEECLAAYCVENGQLFKNKAVLELGGGMTCLAGFMIAQACDPAQVLVTDGNVKCAENLEIILKANQGRMNRVQTARFDWESGIPQHLQSHFDLVICADCLFFDDARPLLIKCLVSALKPGGKAIITAPSRSGTFQSFVRLAREEKSFGVTSEQYNYSDLITSTRHILESDPRYSEDIHYPLLLTLEKRKN